MASIENIKAKIDGKVYTKTTGIYCGPTKVKYVYSGKHLVWQESEEVDSMYEGEDFYPLIEYTPDEDIELTSFSTATDVAQIGGSAFGVVTDSGIIVARASNPTQVSGLVTIHNTDCYKVTLDLDTPVKLMAGTKYYFFGINCTWNESYMNYAITGKNGHYVVVYNPAYGIPPKAMDMTGKTYIGNSDKFIDSVTLPKGSIFKYIGSSKWVGQWNTTITNGNLYTSTFEFDDYIESTTVPENPSSNVLYYDSNLSYHQKWGSSDYYNGGEYWKYVDDTWTESVSMSEVLQLESSDCTYPTISTLTVNTDKKYYLEINGVEV